MYAFYFYGINDLQDVGSTLLTSLKNGKECWVCFFDCLEKKRQLYPYSKEELILFIETLCKVNNLPLPKINYYDQTDGQLFDKDYNKHKPDIVFMQNAVHKYFRWQPTTGKSKVIHFAWGLDSSENLHKSRYKIWLNVLRNESDIEIYRKKQSNIRSKYFGNMRQEQLMWAEFFITYNPEYENKRICFVPEVWIAANGSTAAGVPLKKIGPLMDEVIKFLHENNFYIIWKKREKGEGAKIIDPLPFLNEKPDYVIEKDLNFPSCLYYATNVAEICLFYAPSSAFDDIKSINNKTILLNPMNENVDEEMSKLKEIITQERSELILSSEKPSEKLLEFIQDA